MKRAFSPEAVRAARIAEEALRQLLTAGESPTPDAFARAFQHVQAGLDPDPCASARAAHAYAAAGQTGSAGARRSHRGNGGGNGSGHGNGNTSAENETAWREAQAAKAAAETERAVRAAVQAAQAHAAAEQRRTAGLLAAALAALGGAMSPERGEGGPCVELAARLVGGGDALACADEIQRAIESAARTAGGGSLPWREVSGEALRHLTALLPEGAAVGAELLAARSAIRHAQGPELAAAMESVRRILKRSVLAQ